MATDDINKELNQLRSDLADLRGDVASLVQAMKAAGVEGGKEAYNRAYSRARQAGESVRSQAHDAYDSLNREIEERPLVSVLTAFGTGFVVGMLLDRRH